MATLLNPAQSADHRLKPSDISNVAGKNKYPSLYQINTRVLLNDLSRNLGRRATLDDISDGELDRHTQPVRDHFRANEEFQQKSARFLENHDEPRAAATFPLGMHQAAAVLTYLCPGLRFSHDGQFDGQAKKISVHLSRRPIEPVESGLRDFCARLLNCVHLPETRSEEWRLLNCVAAWDSIGPRTVSSVLRGTRQEVRQLWLS
jgi:hypothetical protein